MTSDAVAASAATHTAHSGLCGGEENTNSGEPGEPADQPPAGAPETGAVAAVEAARAATAPVTAARAEPSVATRAAAEALEWVARGDAGVCRYIQQRILTLAAELWANECVVEPAALAQVTALFCDDCAPHHPGGAAMGAAGAIGKESEAQAGEGQWKVIALLLSAISVLSMLLLFVARTKIAHLQFEMSRGAGGPGSGGLRQRTRSRSGSGTGPTLFANPPPTLASSSNSPSSSSVSRTPRDAEPRRPRATPHRPPRPRTGMEMPS